jgi:hypothetical protein
MRSATWSLNVPLGSDNVDTLPSERGGARLQFVGGLDCAVLIVADGWRGDCREHGIGQAGGGVERRSIGRVFDIGRFSVLAGRLLTATASAAAPRQTGRWRRWRLYARYLQCPN